MYLFLESANFPYFRDIFIESEKITEISYKKYGIYYFAIKDTHWSLQFIGIISKSSVIMEKFLNILEAPRPQLQQQQDNFNEEKVNYINWKIWIWDFFGIPQATYLIYSVEENVHGILLSELWKILWIDR